MRIQLAVGALALLAVGSMQDPQDPMARLRTTLKDNAADFWIYDDLDKGYAMASETGKPLLVSFRCVP